MEEQKRIVLADAAEEFRRMLAEVMEKEPDLDIVGQTGSGEELLDLISRHRPDVVVMTNIGDSHIEAFGSRENTLLANPAWSTLRAVEEGRFHTLDHTLYNVKPNARWGEAYEKLADILYPAG